MTNDEAKALPPVNQKFVNRLILLGMEHSSDMVETFLLVEEICEKYNLKCPGPNRYPYLDFNEKGWNFPQEMLDWITANGGV